MNWLFQQKLSRTFALRACTFLWGAALAFFPSSLNAAAIFTEDFNSYTTAPPNYNGDQIDTGLPVGYGGSVSGWNAAGGNAVHAVETDAATGDWTVMIYNDNSLTQSSGVSDSNDLGIGYTLGFDYGTANYQIESQGTESVDGLEVSILRGDGSVLATEIYQPGDWQAGNYDLEAGLQGTLVYTGDGTGDIRIEISDSVAGQDTDFGGSIDNLSLSTSTPEPAASTLMGIGLIALSWLLGHRRRPA